MYVSDLFCKTFRKKFLLTFLLIATALALMAAAPAQEGAPPDYTNLIATLTWLAGGAGAAVITGWVMALIAENIPAWHSLPGQFKAITPFVLSPVIAILATLAIQNAALIELIQPWWMVIVTSIATYAATQAAYMQARRSGYGIKAQTTAREKSVG